MRNPIQVLKSLEENTRKENYKFERLYRNLYNPEFYLLAYKNIASSQGSMTAGSDGITLDGMSEERINKIIASLKNYSYQPKPARRVYIAKKNSNKKRPLGISSSDDKLVQEVVRMILEAIYEPTFSSNSHGFRPNRSCHTALMEVKNTFTGVKWIIEGDIKACFDNFDHHVLIGILRRKIHDEYFISLMWKLLRTGYMEQWTCQTTYSGTPQGSGVSPILANIYLSELDNFIQEYKMKFNKGEKTRRMSLDYNKTKGAYERGRKKFDKVKKLLPKAERKDLVKQLKALQKKQLETPVYPVIDTEYKRIQYNRYCDDFIIGIIGSKEDAEKVKADVKNFLSNVLHLTMSEEKTRITHSADDCRYLGYDIYVSRDKSVKRNASGILQRVWYGRVQLRMPKEKWENKLLEYQTFKIIKDTNGKEHWKTLHRKSLLNKTDVEIVSKFNSEIRGLYNYYWLATNVSTLDKFYHVMKGSMLKTFAAKYKTKISKVRISYMIDDVFCVDYQTKSGVNRCEFYHNGFTVKKEVLPAAYDTLPQYVKYNKKNSLAERIKAKKCELCGEITDKIAIHHVRRLKDLNNILPSELLMKEKGRKTLALCSLCFKQVQERLL